MSVRKIGCEIVHRTKVANNRFKWLRIGSSD
jgi:hypothetical protein